MLQINPFLDCTIYSGIVVHIVRNTQSKDFGGVLSMKKYIWNHLRMAWSYLGK